MPNKTLLIGVDAGDFRTIDPLLEEGILPNIESLINQGFRGQLSSSVPPWTPTAWTSLTTGKNPGKHGIFDFKVPGTDELVDAGDVWTNTAWDYLSKAGEPSIVVNVPVTHPAREIEGILVPGYLGPEINKAVAHPSGILEELQNKIGEYRIYKSDEPNTDEELCSEYLRLMQMRADAMTYLCDNYDWSFGMVQFQRTDTVFHELPEEKYIRQVYRKLDECVGQLLADVDADNIFLVSDHGMGETGNWDLRINSWLLEQGYLKTAIEGYETGWEKPKEENTDTGNDKLWEQDLLDTIARKTSQLGLNPRRIEKSLQRIGADAIVKQTLPDSWLQMALEEGGERIDVDNSAAYCPSGPGLGIIAEDNVREELIDSLAELRDPDGELVFKWVRAANEVYSGPAVDDAPDVIAYPREMTYYISATLTADVFAESRYAYNHMHHGMILGAGSEIDDVDDNIDADITDVIPTVLSLVGVQLDTELDGVPVMSVLDGVEISGSRTYETVNRKAGVEDRDAVEARLEDLGYME